MNTIKIAAVTLLIAALPFAPTAFAQDRDRGHDNYGREHYQRHQHDHHWRHAHRHHDRHYYRHHQPDYGHGYGYEGRGGRDYRPKVVAPRIVLPLPPLPPVPVIVVKKHHDARIVLRHPY
jgi:hypothetical protein